MVVSVANLAAAVVSELPDVSSSKDGKSLKLGGTFLKNDATLLQTLILAMPTEARPPIDVALFGDASFGAKLRRELLRIFACEAKEAEAKEDLDLSQTFFNSSISCPMSDLKQIINKDKLSRSFLYDPIKDIIHTYDYEILKKRIPALLQRQTPAWLATNSHDCKVTYTPEMANRIEKNEALDETIFNLWTPAPWKKGWELSPEAMCPERIGKLLRHLFPHPESLDGVEAWLRDATFQRADSVLCLIGAPGIGKGLLVEELAAQLVGTHNLRTAARGFTKSQFHANVLRCRVYFLDETALGPDARETLKAYHNAFSTVELKGVDVGDRSPMHASFVLANNSPLFIKLEYADRKFFVPEMTGIPLIKVVGQDGIDKFLAEVRDPSAIQQFASYLYNKFPASSSKAFAKTEAYKSICIGSLPYAFRRFIAACKSKATFGSKAFYSGIGSGNKKFEYYELEDEIRKYEAQFGEPLAELSDPGAEWTVKSKIFKGAKKG